MGFKTRRDFLKAAGASLLSVVGIKSHPVARLAQAPCPLSRKEFRGRDLSDWETVLGDGVYAAPGEAPVDDSDITTFHYGSHSELRANIRQRNIMAHNITFKRIIDENALHYVYTGLYQFRLPYLPAIGNLNMNAQTLEGGMYVWDGGATRLDYGLGFQWFLNPYHGVDAQFGDIRCWTDIDGGKWQKVGYLTPDTDWHTVQMTLDIRRQTTGLTIDGEHYASRFTATPKPATWGNEIAPGLQAEIISIYPGDQGDGALHKAEFKDWVWIWESDAGCKTFLPTVMRLQKISADVIHRLVPMFSDAMQWHGWKPASAWRYTGDTEHFTEVTE